MLFNSLKPQLKTNNALDLIWLAMGSPALAEFAVHAGPGAIVIDLQHGLWQRDTLEAAVGIAASKIPVIVRCAGHQAHEVSVALDAGASAVLIPLVESADDARAAVAASHYPPVGIRSAGGVRPLLLGIDGMIEAGRQVAVGLLIETAEGVRNIEEIAAVPGIDFLFIGTGDLALCRGAATSSALQADCERVLEVARSNNLPCGIFTGNAEAARESFAAGYKLAVSANDIDIVKTGFVHAHHTALSGRAACDPVDCAATSPDLSIQG